MDLFKTHHPHIHLDYGNMTKTKVQNLWWGAGYNIVAVPLSAGVLAFIGLILSPAIGAILMSLSTVIVAINAFTLKLK
ncbi:Cu2+-exporting ATPase [Jeotgalicoccus aerolatus]|uniref:Cu2+-exporting ATPase n=1 Tax=Jeotgalicoccus aerolatus TaxID=709510 RepID=A0A1G9A753_9STAP|nr:Cu2+-exporting ATPase [Jeotgalicoccus aerolatus]